MNLANTPHMPAARRWAPLIALALAACSTPTDLLDDQSCPCVDGWTCNASMICVQGAVDSDSGVDVASTPDARPEDSGVDATMDATMDATPIDINTSDAGPSAPPPPENTTCWARGGALCDWSVAGFRFEPVTTNNFTNGAAGNADFSPDGCSIYYTERTPDHQIYRVDRTGPSMPFGAPILEESVSPSDSDEDGPSLGPDKLELFFASDRGVAGLRRVHSASRTSTSMPWGVPVPIATLDVRGSTGWEPRVAPHGLRLYVALTVAQQRLHVVERSALGGEFGTPVLIGLETAEEDGFDDTWSTNRPSVTHDDRVMTFVAQPPGSNAPDRLGYYMTRADWRDPWSDALWIPETYADMGRRDIGVSADGCELLMRTGFDADARQTILKYMDR